MANLDGVRKDIMTVMASAVNTYEGEVKKQIEQYKADKVAGSTGGTASGGSTTGATGKEISTAETMEIQYLMNEVNIIASTASNIQKAIKDTQSSTIRNFV